MARLGSINRSEVRAQPPGIGARNNSGYEQKVCSNKCSRYTFFTTCDKLKTLPRSHYHVYLPSTGIAVTAKSIDTVEFVEHSPGSHSTLVWNENTVTLSFQTWTNPTSEPLAVHPISYVPLHGLESLARKTW